MKDDILRIHDNYIIINGSGMCGRCRARFRTGGRMTRYYLVSVECAVDGSTSALEHHAHKVQDEIQSNLESCNQDLGVSAVDVRLLPACFAPKPELEK